MAFKDVIFTDDIQILNGDFLVTDSEVQHIEHILSADKGHFRQFPLIGLGILKLNGGSIDKTALKQDIRTQLRSDEYSVRTIEIDGSLNLSIDAVRIK